MPLFITTTYTFHVSRKVSLSQAELKHIFSIYHRTQKISMVRALRAHINKMFPHYNPLSLIEAKEIVDHFINSNPDWGL